MTETAIQQIVQKQRAYFQTGATLDLDFRLQALERLSACIRVNEQAIHKALWQDLGKSPFEGYMCETGMVLSELSYMRRHLRAFAREKGVTPYNYLESLRIGEAKKLLEQGVPPAEAALRTGFSDQSHFTNYFSRFIGLSPGAYREIFTEKERTTHEK